MSRIGPQINVTVMIVVVDLAFTSPKPSWCQGKKKTPLWFSVTGWEEGASCVLLGHADVWSLSCLQTRWGQELSPINTSTPLCWEGPFHSAELGAGWECRGCKYILLLFLGNSLEATEKVWVKGRGLIWWHDDAWIFPGFQLLVPPRSLSQPVGSKALVPDGQVFVRWMGQAGEGKAASE